MALVLNRLMRRPELLGLGAVLVLLACQDDFTAPADCPALCPGGQPPVQEIVLPAADNLDSSYVGYVAPGLGISLRVSNGLAASEDRAIVRFLPRPDTLVLNDTTRQYTIDSVALGFTLQARDTTVDGLRLLLYRLPASIDSTTTFADVDPLLVPANLIDTLPVPDSLASGVLRLVLTGADLDRIDLPAADSGRLAIGVAIEADAPTGIRLASIAATGSPSFVTYANVAGVDSSLQKQVINRFPAFTSFVSENPPVPSSQVLQVGGAPSARSRIKFVLPDFLRDSVTILRATLELTATGPIAGLPGDSAVIQAVGVLGDLGAKSPLIPTSSSVGTVTVLDGASGLVSIDISRLARLWQGRNGLPPVVFLILTPEAASFTVPRFASSRAPSGTPQLRVTYYDKFPFERP